MTDSVVYTFASISHLIVIEHIEDDWHYITTYEHKDDDGVKEVSVTCCKGGIIEALNHAQHHAAYHKQVEIQWDIEEEKQVAITQLSEESQ